MYVMQNCEMVVPDQATFVQAIGFTITCYPTMVGVVVTRRRAAKIP